MQIFVGMWKPRDQWRALGATARTAYLSKLSATTRLKLGSDAESVAWAHNDDAKSKDTCTFFCVWRFPRREMSEHYLTILAEHGWHDYFDTVSVHGDAKTPFDVLTQHVTC